MTITAMTITVCPKCGKCNDAGNEEAGLHRQVGIRVGAMRRRPARRGPYWLGWQRSCSEPRLRERHRTTLMPCCAA
jgi:hypothetical protein